MVTRTVLCQPQLLIVCAALDKNGQGNKCLHNSGLLCTAGASFSSLFAQFLSCFNLSVSLHCSFTSECSFSPSACSGSYFPFSSILKYTDISEKQLNCFSAVKFSSPVFIFYSSKTEDAV